MPLASVLKLSCATTLVTLLVVTRCYAYIGPKSIDQIVMDSQVVTVARLAKYVQDPGAKEEQKKTRAAFMAKGGGAMPGIIFATQLRGTYTFDVQLNLKGDCPNPLTLHLPYIASPGFGVPKVQIREGTSFVLLLSRRDGTLVPTDEIWPIIPLGADVKISAPITQRGGEDPTETIVRLMISGLEDTAVRGPILRTLSGTRRLEIVPAARRYWDDPDYYVKQSALCCLATNQDVEAIPRILAVKQKMVAERRGDEGMGANLAAYQTPQAVAYVNAMLFEPQHPIRLQAMLALRDTHMADKTSIPYLMVALRDPDGTIATFADAALHELIPELGPWQGHDAFVQQRDDEIKKVENWWADELSGRRGNGPQLVRPRSMTPTVPTARPNPGMGRGPAD